MTCDLFESLEFGKLEINPGEEERIDIFEDATVTGFGAGAGADDASHQTNKEAHCIGTSDKPDEGPDASDDLSSKNYKGIKGMTVELYEFLARTMKKHNGNYTPFYEIKYGNFSDVSKHPNYRSLC